MLPSLLFVHALSSERAAIFALLVLIRSMTLTRAIYALARRGARDR
jgi:hypothetical protein